jgi:hypothetical protein
MKKKLTFLAILFMVLSCGFSFGQADPYTNQPANYTYSTPVGTTQNVDIPGGNGSSGSVPIIANSTEWTFNFPDDILDVGTPILPSGFYVYSSVTNGYDRAIKIRNNVDIPAPTPFLPQDFIFTFPVTGTLANQQGTILANVRVLPGFNGVVGNNDSNNDNGSSPIIFTPVNTTPTANPDVATTNENTPVTAPVLTNDTFGGDGPSTGTITITDQPNNGTATVNNGGTPNDPTDDKIVYIPNSNYNGNDTLVYQICDSNGDCDTALVIISVTAGGPLPVQLVSFSAVQQSSNVLISWKVSTEINVKQYEVDYSTDGINFENIGTVSLTNNGNYSFIHSNPVAGFNYYRIKMIDNDGGVGLSDIRKVYFEKSVTETSVYPNPVATVLNITLPSSLLNKPATLSILAMDAKLVDQKRINALSQTETIDVSKIASGRYLIKVETGQEIIIKSIQVIH